MSTKDWIEKDFYKELGVAKGASATEIKKSYRKLAREFHPDKNPGNATAEQRFKDVSEAYDVLSDDAKRKEYDEARTLFAGGAYRGGFGGGYPPPNTGGSTSGGSSTFDMSNLFNQAGGSQTNFDDLLSGLFSQSGASRRTTRSPQGPVRGRDVDAEVTLDFDDAIKGAVLPLQLSGPGTCLTCHGNGAKPGTAPHQCPACSGTGFISSNQGAFGFSEPCRVCQGSGQVIDDPCPTCGGTGATTQTRTITVRVPTGVHDGAKLRIAGKGAPGQRGGPAGDLNVVVHVRAHELFARTGDDLTLTVPIGFGEAAMGTSLRVPTPEGSVLLKVPAGTPSGRTMRVRGRGAAKRGGGNGDLLVTLTVAVPAALSKEARTALEAYTAAQPDDPRPGITALLAARADGAS